jgi:hypothetical protein
VPVLFITIYRDLEKEATDMITVYINYPNPHFTIHGNPSCTFLNRPRKEHFRIITVNDSNLKEVLADFVSNKHDFASDRTKNDMWIELDLAHSEEEDGVLSTIRILLGQRYKPLKDAPIKRHC